MLDRQAPEGCRCSTNALIGSVLNLSAVSGSAMSYSCICLQTIVAAMQDCRHSGRAREARGHEVAYMRMPVAVLAALLASTAASVVAQQADVGGDALPATEARERVDPLVVLEDVRLALRGSKDVPAGAVTAVVHADTIVLTGEVPTEVEAARALAVAEQNSQGVRIASHLTVSGSRPVPTQVPEVVREVESALRADPRTRNLGVVVSIDAEEVIGLHGLVPSRESRAAAEQVAGRVEGVKRVSSRLVVAGE